MSLRALDNLGSSRIHGHAPASCLADRDFVRALAARVHKVFVTASLESSAYASVQGAADAKAAGEAMFSVYSELGCDTAWLPALPVEQRVERLLSELGLVPPARR